MNTYKVTSDFLGIHDKEGNGNTISGKGMFIEADLEPLNGSTPTPNQTAQELVRLYNACAEYFNKEEPGAPKHEYYYPQLIDLIRWLERQV